MTEPRPPSAPPPPSIEQRVAALERSLDELRGIVRSLIDALRSRGLEPGAAPRSPARATQATPPGRPREAPPHRPAAVAAPERREPVPRAATAAPRPPWGARGGEWWLNRAGIVLLLLGVTFLFKYSVDQGWLTPWIRVGFGVALGIALAIIGLRVERKQRWFSPAMLGGAAATFYITGFAAFQLLQLVSYPVAFAFMIAVTVYTFWAAVHQNEALLAILGAAGALSTPFLLYTDAGTLAGLMGYNSLVLAGTSGIYLARGWRSLLWVAVLGGWSVILIGLAPVVGKELTPTTADQVAFQVGVVVAWLATWMVPVARQVLAARDPQRWQVPPPGWAAKLVGGIGLEIADRTAASFSVAGPIVAFFVTRVFWPLTEPVAGTVALGAAAVYGGAWWWLEQRERRVRLASAHGIAVAALVAIGLQYLLDSHSLLITWAVEGVALHAMARRLADGAVRVTAHALFILVGLWLLERLIGGPASGTVVANTQAATDLAVIGALGVASLFLDRPEQRLWYRLGGVIALVGWLWRELTALPEHGYVLVAWSAVAYGLHAAARRFGAREYAVLAHLVFAAVLAGLTFRLVHEPRVGTAVLNLKAALHGVPIAVALLATRLMAGENARRVYGLIGHVAILGWLWYELSRLPAGEGIVTVAWGAYAFALLFVALRRDLAALRHIALGTLFAVIAKLFLVDLARLEAIWRILLFLGFGGVFLVVSYYFRPLRRSGKT